MDWIERWFGMSPDDGDGSLEALIFVALVVIGVWLLVSRSDTLRGRVRSVRRIISVARAIPCSKPYKDSNGWNGSDRDSNSVAANAACSR